jgi:hypothetical protein
MKRLFMCGACGFLSTVGSEFERIDGHIFDKCCAEKYRNKIEPEFEWITYVISKGLED